MQLIFITASLSDLVFEHFLYTMKQDVVLVVASIVLHINTYHDNLPNTIRFQFAGHKTISAYVNNLSR